MQKAWEIPALFAFKKVYFFTIFEIENLRQVRNYNSQISS
ncbi:hypothetical protein EV200_1126 [Pedobacter psychrotolerans]|uniref:Uncharacterized protein n=1 Tax=Pedobacter psychrotolerans TaxID=1843235 RepID=A0A4R2H166_9SPHI|nr:hypothetical protein EV200_1126 [Pedobacter psychrotolerans]